MQMSIKNLFLVLMLILVNSNFAQNYSRQDTLRGSITTEREWWDLKYYHLNIQVDPSDKVIYGVNKIRYKVLNPNNVMQIDLQEPMNIASVKQNEIDLEFSRDGSVYLINLTELQRVGEIKEIDITYGGVPTEAKMPPWVGGISWKTDSNGKHFIASSCQGEGASIWWPCKDHPYDEPDSMLISIRNPSNLVNVSNGRLRSIEENYDGTVTSHWFVSNPINNYGVNINIADYVHFSEIYNGENGQLDCDYYVLRENLDKAKEHFKEVPKMLKAFEFWFGPYPFYEDGYKLVEVPYPGMEHQSSVTYGNGYKNGFGGRDVSSTGWGMKFDFIIVHESGHEWFANSLTNRDVADMWIHEGFTAYSENLFLDYHFGTKACNEYVIGTRKNISNKKPIIGVYDLNSEGSGDMYSKGANMLHTLRQIVNDDNKWRKILRGINSNFYHQVVTSSQIENFIISELDLDLEGFFDQYLRDVRIPELVYKYAEDKVFYKWNNIVENFRIPVKIYLDNAENWITPSSEWGSRKCKESNFSVDENFYITSTEE